MQAQPEQILALAKKSPELVGVHDKAAWLALFSRSGVIEDPVGSAPHQRNLPGLAQKDDPLERFYETFIAPNQIRFESALDVVAGHEVARDVVIHTELSSGARLAVPAYLLYEATQEDGELKLARMAAHWVLPQMSWQVMSSGGRGLMEMMSITGRMLRYQGMWGVVGYMRGMVQGIGSQGVDAVERFAQAVNARDRQTLASLFTEETQILEWPVGAPRTVDEFMSRLPAGAELRIERPISSGFVTACRFFIEEAAGTANPAHPDRPTGSDNPAASGESTGIAFFHFDKESRRLERARFFLSAAA